jgi:hypothetical protein
MDAHGPAAYRQRRAQLLATRVHESIENLDPPTIRRYNQKNERASYNGSIEASQASDVGSIPIARSMILLVRSGEILYRTFRRDSLHFWAKRVV